MKTLYALLVYALLLPLLLQRDAGRTENLLEEDSRGAEFPRGI